MDKSDLSSLIEGALAGGVSAVRDLASAVENDRKLKWDAHARALQSASREFLSASEDWGKRALEREDRGSEDDEFRYATRRLDKAEATLRGVILQFRRAQGLAPTPVRTARPRVVPDDARGPRRVRFTPAGHRCENCGERLERGRLCGACVGVRMNGRRPVRRPNDPSARVRWRILSYKVDDLGDGEWSVRSSHPTGDEVLLPADASREDVAAALRERGFASDDLVVDDERSSEMTGTVAFKRADNGLPVGEVEREYVDRPLPVKFHLVSYEDRPARVFKSSGVKAIPWDPKVREDDIASYFTLDQLLRAHPEARGVEVEDLTTR